VKEQVVTIGRSNDNDITIHDDLISRFHARIEWTEDKPYLIDLGSSNGTRINNNEIEPRTPTPLVEGDVVTIGTLTMTLHLSITEDDIQSTTREAALAEPQAEAPLALAVKEPTLVLTTPDGSSKFDLSKDIITIGRDPASDITIDDQEVSRQHTKMERKPDGYEIKDLGSTNGLTFEEKRIDHKTLANGDVLWLTKSISITYLAPVEEAAPAGVPEKLEVKGQKLLTIGRSPENDIVLDHPAVSRKHARIVQREPGDIYVLEDLGSSNGTYVNGAMVIQSVTLKKGDTIRIGTVKLTYSPEVIHKIDESSNVRLDVFHINQRVSKQINLLQDISLSILPNEFVAIVGGSGAGKTTLMKALNAFNPATDGTVLINGDDLYKNLEAHKSQFGYVPQEDIIHKELTVYEALDYSARLRLPADTTAQDRHKRVTEVLATLDLTERKDLPIRKLSGGQLKRVSIGVELLTKPGLFCLDEATSGLDPGIESQMMRLLRKLCDQGNTILLVTHATKNVMLCDQVIFMARGGYLAYFGPPDQALKFFGVQDFDGIYEKLETTASPKEWAQQYRESAQYKQFIEARLPEHTAEKTLAPRKAAEPGHKTKHISSLMQFLILSRRNMNILIRDRVSLVLMLLLTPIIASLDFFLWEPNMFNPSGGAATKVFITLFMAAMVGFMVGALSIMREFVKEADIYRRERMVTLKIGPYVLSKIWMAIIIALYQAGIFILFMKITGDWPSASQLLAVYITMVLAIFAGMLMGLLVSAVSPNQNIAPLLITMVLVPQLIFGGVIPLNYLGQAGKAIGEIMTTKWAFQSLVTISEAGKDVATDPCWLLPEEERDQLTEEEKIEECTCMGPNIFTKCSFPGIHDFYNESVDTPEPAQPAKPGDPPEEPGDPPPQPEKPKIHQDPEMAEKQYKEWEEEMDEYREKLDVYTAKTDKYREDLEVYQDAVTSYQDEMDRWQEEYQQWKEDRAQAIDKAEAVINQSRVDYGYTFNVDIYRAWGWMLVIMAINFIAILFAIKWKDKIK
jgi:ABC-type multidrug transport system ATPase subunit/pSer/pThr/pTyr-binding forkhead associated (FHA) protein